MFQNYYSDNLISKYIKCLLSETYVPTVGIWKPGTSILSGFTYITYDGYIVRAKKDFIAYPIFEYDSKSKNTSTSSGIIGSVSQVIIDGEVSQEDIPVDVEKYGVKFNDTYYLYLKEHFDNGINNFLCSYFCGDIGGVVRSRWNMTKIEDLGPESTFDSTYFDVIKPYVQGEYYPGVSSNYESNSALYDSNTHYYLGNYLRMLRDINNIDLMQYYNCYSGDMSDSIRIKQSDIKEYVYVGRLSKYIINRNDSFTYKEAGKVSEELYNSTLNYYYADINNNVDIKNIAYHIDLDNRVVTSNAGGSYRISEYDYGKTFEIPERDSEDNYYTNIYLITGKSGNLTINSESNKYYEINGGGSSFWYNRTFRWDSTAQYCIRIDRYYVYKNNSYVGSSEVPWKESNEYYALQSIDAIYNGKVNDSNKVYIVPIKFNKIYSIYIDSYTPFKIQPVYYDGVFAKGIYDYSEDRLIGSTTVNYCSKTQPFIFNSIISIQKSVENVLSTSKLVEDHLVLLVQVPKSNKSPLVVLEGDYSDIGLNNNSLPKLYVGNGCSDPLIFKSVPSLTRNLGNVENAFSDRLIEYLMNNVIVKNSSIKNNIERVQSYITSSTALKKLGNVYSKEIKKDVWDYNMQYYIYNLVTSKNNKFNKLYADINGFIDKDTEFILSKADNNDYSNWGKK